jgi:hypothetical protein
MKTLFFYNATSGEPVGRHVLPRPQSKYENCTIHNYNIAPHRRKGLLVHGSYQSGTALVDFTDLTDIRELAWMDPPPLDPPSETSPGGRTTYRGGDWASYWYNALIYESDARRGLYRLFAGRSSAAAGRGRLSANRGWHTRPTVVGRG